MCSQHAQTSTYSGNVCVVIPTMQGLFSSQHHPALLPCLDPPPCCRILFSLLFALIAAGILSIFFHNKVMNIVISGIGAAVFSCYIVFDVQLMMGGGTYSIEPDEYVFAGELEEQRPGRVLQHGQGQQFFW